MLTRKLNAIKREKAAGFSELPTITTEENVYDVLIRRKIIKELKLLVPSVKLYMGHLYSQLQTYIRGCQHVFNTRPTTYRKDFDRVLF